MDHVPILMGLHGEDISPGPGELRFASPLLLKDKRVAGDLVGAVSGVFSTDDPNQAVWMYIPGQGSFLVSLLPMKDGVAADVFLSRISFQEGGHSWEFVTGAPVSRADRIWVLHQPDFRPRVDRASGPECRHRYCVGTRTAWCTEVLSFSILFAKWPEPSRRINPGLE